MVARYMVLASSVAVGVKIATFLSDDNDTTPSTVDPVSWLTKVKFALVIVESIIALLKLTAMTVLRATLTASAVGAVEITVGLVLSELEPPPPVGFEQPEIEMNARDKERIKASEKGTFNLFIVPPLRSLEQ